MPQMPSTEKLCGRAAGSLSLRQPKGLLLHLHHPLLPPRHERADLHRHAVLRPTNATAPSGHRLTAPVSHLGQQAETAALAHHSRPSSPREASYPASPALPPPETKSPAMVSRLPRPPMRVSFSFRKSAAKRMVTTGMR